MGPAYPDPQRPRHSWFWPVLLGWLSLASMTAIAVWLTVSTVANLREHHETLPQTALAPPS